MILDSLNIFFKKVGKKYSKVKCEKSSSFCNYVNFLYLKNCLLLKFSPPHLPPSHPLFFIFFVIVVIDIVVVVVVLILIVVVVVDVIVIVVDVVFVVAYLFALFLCKLRNI